MQLTTHTILVLLGSVLGGGVGVSLVAQAVKKLGKMESEKLIHTLVVAVSLISGAAQYVLQYHSKLPTAFLGISTASIYGFSQLVFKGSKYANEFLGKVYTSNATVTPATSNVSAASTDVVSTPTEPPVLAV